MLSQDKRGQFYLMASIVIVVIIIGFVSVTNYAKHSSVNEVYNVKNELGLESDNVLEYGTLRIDNQTEKSNLMERFSSNYTRYAGEKKEIYIIYGNAEQIFVATYSDISEGGVSVDFGSGVFSELEITEASSRISKRNRGKAKDKQEITLKVGDIERTFNLKEGENFYFIVSQELGGQTYIAESE